MAWQYKPCRFVWFVWHYFHISIRSLPKKKYADEASPWPASYSRHQKSHPGAWPLTLRWILLLEDVNKAKPLQVQFTIQTALERGISLYVNSASQPVCLREECPLRSIFIRNPVRPLYYILFNRLFDTCLECISEWSWKLCHGVICSFYMTPVSFLWSTQAQHKNIKK